MIDAFFWSNEHMTDTNTATDTNTNQSTLTALTADIVSAFVGSQSNHVDAAGIPDLIALVYNSLNGLSQPAVVAEVKQEPAVSIRASIKPDFIVCLEDGTKLKMLKRYLMTNFSMTPDQYRAKWNLPADYPMVAPNYAEKRRELAKKIGLGTAAVRRKSAVAEVAAETATARPRRNKKADTSAA